MPFTKKKKEMEKGGILDAKSSLKNETGSWKVMIPVIDEKKCIHCMKCAAYCPDSAIKNKNGKRTKPDMRYCKGCGLCANICPVGAIKMVPVEEWKKMQKEKEKEKNKK